SFERCLVPPRCGQLAGKQVKLVGQVLLPGQRLESEGPFLDSEVESELSAGRDLVEFVQPEFAESRGYQRRLAQLGVDGFFGREALQTASEPHPHRDAARLMRRGQ